MDRIIRWNEPPRTQQVGWCYSHLFVWKDIPAVCLQLYFQISEVLNTLQRILQSVHIRTHRWQPANLTYIFHQDKCYIFQKKRYLPLKHRTLEGALSRKRMIPPWRKDTKWWRHWRTTTFVSHSPDIVGSSDNTGAWDLFLGHLNLIKSKLCHCKWKAIKK